jgi:branched-subunit amino acid transport protein
VNATGALRTIAAMGLVLFAVRVAGFRLAGAALPPRWERGLAFVPIATLTALTVTSLLGPADARAIRLVAAATTALVAWRSRRAWAAILAGLACYWAWKVS